LIQIDSSCRDRRAALGAAPARREPDAVARQVDSNVPNSTAVP
jgi:hypothetical protein